MVNGGWSEEVVGGGEGVWSGTKEGNLGNFEGITDDLERVF